MSRTSNFVFTALHIIAWIIFVGLCIEAGGLIVNFFFNMFNPEFVPKLYQKLDLSTVYQENRFVFFNIYSFVLIISILKAYLFYIVIRLMQRLDLTKPFNSFVSNQIQQLSYFTLSIGILSYLAIEVSRHYIHRDYITENVLPFWNDSQAFILMGAVIYIIATIFKKGVDIQNENDLTV